MTRSNHIKTASALLFSLLLAFQIGCGEGFEESEPIDEGFSEEVSGLVITEDFDEKIRGGKDVKTSPPDFVAIYQVPTGNDPHPICGGTLVDKNTVLTAAHCLEDGGRFVACLGTRKVGECADIRCCPGGFSPISGCGALAPCGRFQKRPKRPNSLRPVLTHALENPSLPMDSERLKYCATEWPLPIVMTTPVQCSKPLL